VHAHGAGTQEGDRAEVLAIRKVASRFGLGALPVVAAKSYFGSLGAGSAAVELITSLMALQKGHLFETLNFLQGDDAEVLVARKDTPSGEGFLHLSYSPQGQASSVLVKRFVA
jgi:3-oxoacyl-[acyl-carrier-protein] synthase II